MSALEVYQLYHQKYNTDPVTSDNLIKFGNSIGKPISFKEAKMFMFDLVSGKIQIQKNHNNTTSHKRKKTKHNKIKNEVTTNNNMNIQSLNNIINELKNEINIKNLELTKKDIKINELNNEINILKNNNTPSKSKNSVELSENTIIQHSLNDISNKFKPKKKKNKNIYIPPSPTNYVKKFPPPTKPPPISSTNILNTIKKQSQSQKIININQQPISYDPRQAFMQQRHVSMPILYQNEMDYNQQQTQMYDNNNIIQQPFNWQKQAQMYPPPPGPPPQSTMMVNNGIHQQSTSLPNVLNYNGNGMQSRKSDDEISMLKNYSNGVKSKKSKVKQRKKK